MGPAFTNWMSPQSWAFSRDLQDKSQSSRYSSGVGTVVTINWCQIKLIFLRCTRSHKEACKYQNTFLSGINNFMRVASCKTCLIAYTINKGPDQAAH